jgi:hypothetical protein
LKPEGAAAGAGSGTGAAGAGGAAATATNGNGAAPAWVSQLPEKLRANPEVVKYKTVGDFTESSLAAISRLGKSVTVPGPDASAEERQAFWGKVGRPEAADKYELPIPKERVVDQNFLGAAREAFHKAGLTNSQAAELTQWFLAGEDAAISARVDQLKTEIAGYETELKTEWGHAYEQKSALAVRAKEALAEGEFKIPGFVEYLEEHPEIESHPAVMKLLVFLGEAMGEDKNVTGDVRIDPDAAKGIQEQIDAMIRDPKHPLNIAGHPGHKAALERKTELFRQLYGDAPAGRNRGQ